MSEALNCARRRQLSKLDELIASIPPPSREIEQQAREHQARLTKPPGSLGYLEELSVRLASLKHVPFPRADKKTVIVMAGDHGVATEGVSAYPQEVTAQMVANFLAGGAGINVLARHVGARVAVVDMGVRGQVSGSGLTSKKIREGTANMVEGPAMSREEAVRAVNTGIEVLEEELAKGLDLVATGDMGIGNTTASAAILSVLAPLQPVQAVGRGTGVSDDVLKRKVDVVERAIALNQPDASDPLDVLAKVGGFEIGGLAGVILGAAAHRLPVVVDGFISGAAALVAIRLAPQARPYLFAAHLSAELGHEALLGSLGERPLLDMDLRLGEGTGAVLAMNLIDAACKVLADMATFDEAGVSDGRG